MSGIPLLVHTSGPYTFTVRGFTLGQVTADTLSVIKRDGRVVPFDIERIKNAITGAWREVYGHIPDPDTLDVIACRVRDSAIAHYDLTGMNPSVELIQDEVERELVAANQYGVAKTYILYRAKHAEQRAERPVPTEVKAAFDEAAAYFPTPLQQFQFFDKYSRFNEALGRRETWVETVDRTVAFLRELADAQAPGSLDDGVFERIRSAILKMEVMPSMRLLAMAGPAARRNSMALYNCLSRDTKFITNLGVASFEDFEDGDEVTVLAPSGLWRKAIVRHYGDGYLNRVTFRRSSTIQQVSATSNHRWLLNDGRETDALKSGDVLRRATYPIQSWRYEDASPQERIYWAYGFVYGDGTLVKGNKGEYGHSMVRLCGEKAKYAERFEELGFKASSSASLNGDIMAYTGTYLKTLPDIAHDGPDLVRAFVVGYLNADGHRSTGGNANPYTSIQSSNPESIKFIRDVFPAVGAYITCERDLTGQETNYGSRGETIHFGLLTGSGERGQCYYSTKEIEASVEAGQLWCLEVEDEHAFVLPSGIVTGNCSYQAVDSLDAFHEALLISMAGCGVGFSVERKYVDKLPTVKPQRESYRHIKRVEDSAEGWADALSYGIGWWFDGEDVKFDYSLIRPAGAVLKTKGGRASGPGPLKEMLDGVRDRILSRQGQKLRPIDCHDIMCMVGQAAVSGGVRRTAMISLFDEDDHEMLAAKAPGFEQHHSYRWNANNSAVRSKASMDNQQEFAVRFMEMVEGGNGEPGIFSRDVANALRPSRRQECDFGTNPCFAAGTLVQTRYGHFPIESLVGKSVDIWNGTEWQGIDNFRITSKDEPMLKITLHDGSEMRATRYHTFILEGGTRLTAYELVPGMRLEVASAPQTHGTLREDGAYLKGFLLADGTHIDDRPVLYLYEPKYGCADRLISSAEEIEAGALRTSAKTELSFNQAGENRMAMTGLSCRKDELLEWTTTYKFGLPKRVFAWDLPTKRSFLAGLFDGDGTASDTRNGFLYQLSSVSKTFLLDVQALLKTIGVRSHLSLMKEAGSCNFNDGYGEYQSQACWRLTVSQVGSVRLAQVCSFSRLASFASKSVKYNVKPRFNKIAKVELDGVDDLVYCCTVEGSHSFALTNGIQTAQCGEIVLRSMQFCNLTAAVIRADDTHETLIEKVVTAAIVGTIQSLATTFPGLRTEWKRNCKEERLLGVDITGQQDNPTLLTPWSMSDLKYAAMSANAIFANRLGINKSAAITCVKPSGNTSQLVDCASGLHARWAPYYIRNVRVAASSPLAKVLKDAGVPMKPENGDDPLDPRTWVVSFPVKSPDGAVTRNDRSAVEQCEWWLRNKLHWTEHNPSVTITYKSDEVIDLMKWVWDHREKIGGMAFLPSFDAKYDQLPYIEIGKEEYERRVAEFPEIDFSKIYRYETDDRSKASSVIACEADVCVFSSE